MEPVDTLDRNTLLKRLKKHKKYSNLSQKEIGSKLGSIDNLRYELNKLDKKTSIRRENKPRNKLPPNITSDNLEDVMIRSDTNTLQKLCLINKNAYALCNSEQFWLKKYHYDGYSTFVFNHFNSQGDFEDYIYEYNYLLPTQTHMNNVLMTMQVESKYDQYKANHIRIDNVDDIFDMYLYFLKDIYNDYYKILEDNNDSHQYLDIKCKDDGFEFYLDGEDILYFNKSDTLEFLMVYSYIEDKYLYDQHGQPYVEHVNDNDVIATRRRGIVATLQYFHK